MRLQRKWLAAVITTGVLTAVGVGTAVASSTSPVIDRHAEAEDGEDGAGREAAEDQAEGPDTPISDQDDVARASQVALAWLQTEHGATGTVSATEVDDEESYYEIEVTLEDGRQVDVQLTETFEVVGLD